MDTCRGSFFYARGSFNPSDRFDPSVFASGTSLYEVIRIHKGFGLFLEDHWRRLQKSALSSGHRMQLPEAFSVNEVLRNLIVLNRLVSGNIKLVYHIHEDISSFYAFFIPHHYPTLAMYKAGVDTDLLMAARPDPNTKMIRQTLRNASLQLCQSHQLYEVLLVNDENIITEGSRSNVFFIKDDVIYTAPEAIILKGITRQKVLELCKMLQYKVLKSAVPANELSQFEAAFLTGTSPQVLPIRRIGSFGYNPHHPITVSLLKAYQELVQEYVQKHSFNWLNGSSRP